jgi:hypothetical protein
MAIMVLNMALLPIAKEQSEGYARLSRLASFSSPIFC